MDALAAESEDDHAVTSNEVSSVMSNAVMRDHPIRSPNQPDVRHQIVTGHDETRVADDVAPGGRSKVGIGTSVVNGDGRQWQRTDGALKEQRYENSSEFPVGKSVSEATRRARGQSNSVKPVARVAPIVVTPPVQKSGGLRLGGSSNGPSKKETSLVGHGTAFSSSFSVVCDPVTSQPEVASQRDVTSRAAVSVGNIETWNVSRVDSVEIPQLVDASIVKDLSEIGQWDFNRRRSPDENRSAEDWNSGDQREVPTPEDQETVRRRRSERDRQLLERSNFYYPHLNRSTSKAKLRNTTNGTFLIRNSSDPRYEYVMSLRTAHGVTSVRLVRNTAGLILLDCDPTQADRMPAFASVLDLVEGYLRGQGDQSDRRSQRVYLGSTGQQDVVLDLVKAFEDSPATLAHLCRKRINGLIPVRGGNDVINNLLEFTDTAHRQIIKAFLNEYPYRI